MKKELNLTKDYLNYKEASEYMCMSLRGVHKHDVSTITTRFTGEFDTNENLRERFIKLTNS